MKKHELKTWHEYFDAVFIGKKTFEVRKNDRNYKVGDMLILREWDDVKEKYTGRSLTRSISYVLEGGNFGIEKGYVVLGIYN